MYLIVSLLSSLCVVTSAIEKNQTLNSTFDSNENYYDLPTINVSDFE